ncbi:NAD(P)H:quinone oxidoreductase, type IV, partial [Neoconidiobolus thromboides FSU 785]
MPVASKKNKKKVNNSSNNTVSTPVQNTVKSEPVILPNNGKPKLFILFYTTYLHIYKMALEIKKGAEKQGKCDVYLYQIPETLSKEALKKVRAPPKPNVPYITTDLLRQADGILFGFPTRYGILPAQLKDFIDSCGQLWAKGELAGKMAGTFVSTATQHGGQETSILTFLTTLAHFGIIYVPFGYSSPHLNNDTEILGGSPWGSSVIAGKDGTRQPSELELEIANLQGENFSKTLARY